jgi:hypothetical protein
VYLRTTIRFTLFILPNSTHQFISTTISAKMKAYWFDNEEVGAQDPSPAKGGLKTAGRPTLAPRLRP